MLIRKLVIELKTNIEEADPLAELAVPALLEYCGAVVASEAGLSAEEFFVADNGVTLHVKHDYVEL